MLYLSHKFPVKMAAVEMAGMFSEAEHSSQFKDILVNENIVIVSAHLFLR